MDIKELLHPNTEQPQEWMSDKGFLLSFAIGFISKKEIYLWDQSNEEFYGDVTHHIPLDKIEGWICLAELELELFKKVNGDGEITEVCGFSLGDKVRLQDGDGRTHVISEFVEVEGIHGPNFFHVIFEDDTARDHIFPGEHWYAQTNMIKVKDNG